MRAVASTIERVGKRAGAREGIEEEEVQEARKARCIHNDAEGGILKRELGWPEAMALGIGGMVGAGILVATGKAAYVSGPSVIVSYFISGMAALLSSLCYTEFAAELPSAGGAFTYMSAAAATPARPKIATVARTRVFMRNPPGMSHKIRFVSNNKLTLKP